MAAYCVYLYYIGLYSCSWANSGEKFQKIVNLHFYVQFVIFSPHKFPTLYRAGVILINIHSRMVTQLSLEILTQIKFKQS